MVANTLLQFCPAITQDLATFDSMLMQVADAGRAPEVLTLRERMRQWRFYDHFRVDADAPARQQQLGTQTPVLSQDGRDLASALQTILDIGDARALDAAVSDAFPGSRVGVSISDRSKSTRLNSSHPSISRMPSSA